MVIRSPGMFELEIFRAGKRTDSSGRSRGYTTADLDEAVESYNPDHFKAPLIISRIGGHNTGGIADDSLAYSELAFGYPERLKRVGDRLIAEFERIAPEFVQWVKEGRILDRSASFYLPDAPTNPHPGKFALRHIAALGTSPPAVKGMESMATALSEFAIDLAEVEGVVSFGFSSGVAVFRGLRDWLIEQHGLDAANIALPEHAIHEFEVSERCLEDDRRYFEDCVRKDIERLTLEVSAFVSGRINEFSGGTVKYSKDQIKKALGCSDDEANGFMEAGLTPEQLTKITKMYPDGSSDFSELEETIATLKAENAALRLEIHQQAQKADRVAVAGFVEAQIVGRKILPDDRQSTIDRLMAMPTTTINFSEGEPSSPRAMLMAEIEKRPPLYGAPIDISDKPEDVNFSELQMTLPDGYSVDPESAQLFKKVKAYQQTNNVEFTEALSAVRGNR